MGKGKPLFGFKKLIVVLFWIGQSSVLWAQISDGSLPESFLSGTKSSELVPSFLLDSVKVDKQISDDKNNGIPNRLGVVQTVSIDIKEVGVHTTSGNMNIWRYEIQSPDALSLGVNFETYDLPEGAGVFIYSIDKQKVSGAFTKNNNSETNQLELAQFPGNSLIIEYNEPVQAEFEGQLVIGAVSSAYLDLKSVSNSWVQINCGEGQDWQTEKHAVCLMTFNDGIYMYYCTGSLVNNVREDGTPYFLSANHCISSSKVAQTLVTYFNYENSTCSSNDASLSQSLSGASLVATNSYSDFTLLKLSENPPEEYTPYFAGWNASDDSPSTGTSIHHPEGSYKCIALDYDAPQSYRYILQWDDDSRSMPNSHWEVSYDVGTDESGSSGCPLFDENKRIIGQLHGGDSDYSYFGRFAVSWNHSTVTTEQLKNWLDPDNTGTLRLDGINTKNTPLAAFSADVSYACLNTTVYFTDESKFSPKTWLWKFEPSTITFSNGTSETSQNPKVIFNEEGLYTVTLIAGNDNGFDTVRTENYIEAVSQLDVSFPGIEHEITLCGSELQNYVLVADGADNFTFEISEASNFDIEVSSDSLILTLKDQFLAYGSFDTYIKVSGSHGSCFDSDSILLHVVMPANDNIEYSAALKLGRNSGYSNECATAQSNEPNPLSSDSFEPNSVWFTFYGPSNGIISIQTEGFDTHIAVYEAESFNDILDDNYALLEVAANSSSGSEAGIENLQVTPLQKYWLQVYGDNGDSGDLTVTLLANSIEVYPNPSSGIFNLTVASEEVGTVETEVFSVTGQRVYHNTFPLTYDSNTFTMDLSGVANGMYLFRAIINGQKMTKKIIVAH